MGNKSKSSQIGIYGNWGYAIVKDNAIWIPVVHGDLRKALDGLYKKTGIKRMIFSAILNPESFKQHLKNIVREWDEWFEEIGDFSHCIEIEYQPKINKKAILKHNKNMIQEKEGR